jgi:hypothetical protein
MAGWLADGGLWLAGGHSWLAGWRAGRCCGSIVCTEGVVVLLDWRAIGSIGVPRAQALVRQLIGWPALQPGHGSSSGRSNVTACLLPFLDAQPLDGTHKCELSCQPTARPARRTAPAAAPVLLQTWLCCTTHWTSVSATWLWACPPAAALPTSTHWSSCEPCLGANRRR